MGAGSGNRGLYRHNIHTPAPKTLKNDDIAPKTLKNDDRGPYGSGSDQQRESLACSYIVLSTFGTKLKIGTALVVTNAL